MDNAIVGAALVAAQFPQSNNPQSCISCYSM